MEATHAIRGRGHLPERAQSHDHGRVPCDTGRINPPNVIIYFLLVLHLHHIKQHVYPAEGGARSSQEIRR